MTRAHAIAYASLFGMVVATIFVQHLIMRFGHSVRLGLLARARAARLSLAIALAYLVALSIVLLGVDVVWPDNTAVRYAVLAISLFCVFYTAAISFAWLRRSGPLRFSWGTLISGVALCMVPLVASFFSMASWNNVLAVPEYAAGALLMIHSVAALANRRAVAQALAGSPVLFLRTFAEEWRPFFRPTEEEATKRPDWDSDLIRHGLALDVFLNDEIERRVGSLIALGNPEDYSFPIVSGAARVYAGGDSWQSQFSSLMLRAAAIIVAPGESKWVSWELAEISQRGLHTKLFLVTPPELPPLRPALAPQDIYSAASDRVMHWLVPGLRKLNERDWPLQGFREHLIQVGYRGLPDPLPRGAVISFNADRSAKLLTQGARTPGSFVEPIAARASTETPRGEPVYS